MKLAILDAFKSPFKRLSERVTSFVRTYMRELWRQHGPTHWPMAKFVTFLVGLGGFSGFVALTSGGGFAEVTGLTRHWRPNVFYLTFGLGAISLFVMASMAVSLVTGLKLRSKEMGIALLVLIGLSPYAAWKRFPKPEGGFNENVLKHFPTIGGFIYLIRTDDGSLEAWRVSSENEKAGIRTLICSDDDRPGLEDVRLVRGWIVCSFSSIDPSGDDVSRYDEPQRKYIFGRLAKSEALEVVEKQSQVKATEKPGTFYFFSKERPIALDVRGWSIGLRYLIDAPSDEEEASWVGIPLNAARTDLQRATYDYSMATVMTLKSPKGEFICIDMPSSNREVRGIIMIWENWRAVFRSTAGAGCHEIRFSADPPRLVLRHPDDRHDQFHYY